MEPVTVACGLLSLSLLLFFFFFVTYRVQRPLPPGPRGLHSLRLLLRAALSGTLHLEAEKWAWQYGHVVMCHTPGRKLVFLNSSRAIREVFADKCREQVTNDRPRTFSGWFTMYNFSDIIMGSPHHPGWAKLRKLFHSSIRFYGDGVERFESTVQIELRRLIDRVLSMTTSTSEHERSERWTAREVDMSDLMSYSLLCVLGVLLTGDCPEPDSDVVVHIKQFDRGVNALFNPSTEGVLTVFPFLRHFPGYYSDVCRDVTRSRDELLNRLFTQMKATRQPVQPRGIVDFLLEEQQKHDAHWLTDTKIKGVIMDIVIAAYLTSRETLLDLFLYLQHFPDIMRQIQEEVDRVIGQRLPRVEDRSKLPYTEAVILETLRHSSFVPLGVPHECRDDVMFEDLRLPKGSMLFANLWVCHRDPEVFANPDQFRPERFLDDTGCLIASTHPTRQNLISFGAGRRSCPGEKFALSRVFLYVTTLLQKFDILPPLSSRLLPLHRESWENGAMLHLKPYRCLLRLRS